MSLTVTVSVPAFAYTSSVSVSSRSMAMLAMLRLKRTRFPLAAKSMSSPMALPLKSSVSVPAWPSTVSLPSPGSRLKRVVAFAERRAVGALVAVHESSP